MRSHAPPTVLPSARRRATVLRAPLRRGRLRVGPPLSRDAPVPTRALGDGRHRGFTGRRAPSSGLASTWRSGHTPPSPRRARTERSRAPDAPCASGRSARHAVVRRAPVGRPGRLRWRPSGRRRPISPGRRAGPGGRAGRPAGGASRRCCGPQTYPHPADDPGCTRPTSPGSSWPAPYAYKMKKPVDLGFLDFSTLERRARRLPGRGAAQPAALPATSTAASVAGRARRGLPRRRPGPARSSRWSGCAACRPTGMLPAPARARGAPTPRLMRRIADAAGRASTRAAATGPGVDEHGGLRDDPRQLGREPRPDRRLRRPDALGRDARRDRGLRRRASSRAGATCSSGGSRTAAIRDGHGDLHAGESASTAGASTCSTASSSRRASAAPTSRPRSPSWRWTSTTSAGPTSAHAFVDAYVAASGDAELPRAARLLPLLPRLRARQGAGLPARRAGRSAAGARPGRRRGARLLRPGLSYAEAEDRRCWSSSWGCRRAARRRWRAAWPGASGSSTSPRTWCARNWPACARRARGRSAFGAGPLRPGDEPPHLRDSCGGGPGAGCGAAARSCWTRPTGARPTTRRPGGSRPRAGRALVVLWCRRRGGGDRARWPPGRGGNGASDARLELWPALRAAYRPPLEAAAVRIDTSGGAGRVGGRRPGGGRPRPGGGGPMIGPRASATPPLVITRAGCDRLGGAPAGSAPPRRPGSLLTPGVPEVVPSGRTGG